MAPQEEIADEIPATLHVGSGRDFNPDWLNLDRDPSWRPDVVADIASLTLSSSRQVATERFGPIVLAPGSFRTIIAYDVLEHIVDLVPAMTNCLDLLVVDGTMKIRVPYDLSLGAWQDPTHVRAFNENSFAYFCEWFWYAGFATHRFHKSSLDLQPSEFGQAMIRAGRPTEEVFRTPRAIDSVHVELVKRRLDDADRAELARYRRAPARS